MIKGYYNNNRIYEFQANITSITINSEGLYSIELDETYFYPEGGGQPGDIGYINNIKIINTIKEDDKIFHISEESLTLCKAECSIDKEHRDHFMIQHTGQHLISAILKHELNIDTLSVHLGKDLTTIEIDRDSINNYEIELIEEVSYKLITSGKKVIYHETDDAGIKNFPIRRDSKFNGYIRIVEIEDYDFVPCGGVHLKNLYEIGLVKITGWEKIRGNIRLILLIGFNAYKEFQLNSNIIKKCNKELSTTTKEIIEGINLLKQNISDLKLDKKDLLIKLSVILEESIIHSLKNDSVIKIDNIPGELYNKLTSSLLKKVSSPCLILNISEKINWYLLDPVNKINYEAFKESLKIINGKGGGKSPLWQGIGDKEQLEKFVISARVLL